MASNDWLMTGEITKVFSEEIRACGGRVKDVIEDGERLFARAVLRDVKDVCPGDPVNGGVAMKASRERISVYPYIMRQVCANGHIMPFAEQTTSIDRDENTEGIFMKGEIESRLRVAIRACCLEEAFASGVNEMRSAIDSRIDVGLFFLIMDPSVSGDIERMRGEESPSKVHRLVAKAILNFENQEMMSRELSLSRSVLRRQFGSGTGKRVNEEVMHRFSTEGDGSRYGLMNAITSVARDTRDPETRWRLEKLGGLVPVLDLPDAIDRDRFRNEIERIRGERVGATNSTAEAIA